MQTNRSPFHVKSTGQLPVLRLFSIEGRSSGRRRGSARTGSRRRASGRAPGPTSSFRPSPSTNGRDRLAKARVGSRVVVVDVDPLPFEDHARADRRASWSASARASTRQCPPSSKRQPVLAVAQVRGQRGGSPGRIDQEIGQRVADQVDGRQAVEAGTFEARAGSGLRRIVSPHCEPRPAGRASSGLTSRGRHAEQVGQAVEVEVDGLGRTPPLGVDRPRLEGELRRPGGGPIRRCSARPSTGPIADRSPPGRRGRRRRSR